MRWWRVLLVILAFGLVSVVLLDTAPGPIVDADDRPVVIASMPCANRLQAMSSGFVIDDQTVVTVAHALYESRDFAVRDSNGQWHDGAVRSMDLERDLAIIDVPGLVAEPARTRLAERNDVVRMVAGAASGTTEGAVIRSVRLNVDVIGDRGVLAQRRGYELSVAIASGDSGAAILDEDDNLVGVVFARSTRRDAAWATSVSEIDAVRNLATVPNWDCVVDVGAELQLDAREPSERRPGPVVN